MKKLLLASIVALAFSLGAARADAPTDAPAAIPTTVNVGASQTSLLKALVNLFFDSSPATGNITAADAASTFTTGQSGQSIVTGTPTANSSVSFAVNGQSAYRVLFTGTWSGTIEPDISNDGGTTWTPAGVYVSGTGVTSSALTGNGLFHSLLNGVTNVRFRATAWTSGTLTVRIVTTPTVGLTSEAANGSDAAGVTQLSGGNGIRGWLSGLFAGVGTTADTAWSGSGNGSSIAVLKAIYNQVLGYVSGSTTSGQRLALTGCAVTTSAPSYTTAQTNYSSCDANGDLRVILPSNQPAIPTNPQAATTGGETTSTPLLVSTASTNSTSVKASAAGTLYGVQVVQTTTTLGDLRLYDSAAAPTCSSATGLLKNIPIQSNATSPGVIMNFGPFGLSFTNGLGFCFTGVVANNDNTNWGGTASGVAINVDYK